MRPAVPSENSILSAGRRRVVAGHEVVVIAEVVCPWPLTVLQPSIRLTAGFHPAVRGLLLERGFEADGESFATERAGGVRELADLIHPNRIWPDGRQVRLDTKPMSRKRRIRAMCTAASSGRALHEYAGHINAVEGPGAVLVSIRGRRVFLRPHIPELGPEGEIVVHVEQFETLCDTFAAMQVAVIERGAGGNIAAMRLWGDGLVVVRHGETLHDVEVTEFTNGSFVQRSCSIGDALEDSYRWFDDGREVVAPESLLELADLVAAIGSGREGLTGDQDECCSKYAAAARGLVCALPPGGGKTVVAVRCLDERQDRAKHTGHIYRSVCVVPAVLVAQWRETFMLWAPEMGVSEQYANWRQTGGVLLVTHAKLRELALAVCEDEVQIDDLVIDEAHVVSGGAAGEHLVHLREWSRRALALTGTVLGRRGRRGASEIVALTLGGGDLQRFDSMQARGGIESLYPVVYSGGGSEQWPRLVQAAYGGASVGEDVERAAAGVEVAWTSLQALEAGGRTGHVFSHDGAAARRRVAQGRNAVRTAVAAFNAAASRADSAASVALLETLDEPAIVFCDETDTRDIINNRWEGCVVLDGRVRPEDRARIAMQFQSGQTNRLVLTRTSSLGLNLQRANVMVFADHVSNAETIRQRIGRAARIGHDGSTLRVIAGAGPGRVSKRAIEAVLRGESFDDVWFAGMVVRWWRTQVSSQC